MLQVITLTAVLLNIVLGLFIYRKNPQSLSNRLFFAFSLTNALWAVFNYFSIYPPGSTDSIVWLRFHLCISTAHAFLFFLLITTFPREHVTQKPRWLYPYVSLVLIAMAATLSPYVFENTVQSNGHVQTIPGPLIPLFAVVAFGTIGLGLLILIRKYRRATGVLKAQLRYILLGTSILFGLIFGTVFIPVLTMGSSYFVAYMPAYTFAFVGAVAYAITRHQLFDIRPIVTRSVAYTFLIAITLAAYTLAIFGVSQLLQFGQPNTTKVIVYAVLALFVALTFQPLKQAMEQTTDRFFYKSRYHSNDLLYNFTKILAANLRLEDISRKSLELLIDTLKLTRGAILIPNQDGFYQPVASHGFTTELEQLNNLAQPLANIKSDFIFEEDPEDEMRKVMHQLNVVAIIPLHMEDQRQSLLIVGEKQSGEVYTSQDINVLKIIGPELSVAMQNAWNYQQMGLFNERLRQEVDRATEQLKAVNEQLHKKNLQLQQLDQMKDEFISVTSHELRTPLTAIRGYLWMAMNGKKKDENYQLYMDRAYTSTERLIALVNDTLDISRIESGRVKLSPQPANLVKLAEEVATELSPKATEHHQTLKIKQHPGLPAAECDPDKIHQVLINLIGNALKFTPDGGTVTVTFTADQNTVTAAVTDNGPGISPDDQPKLFQKFSRLEATQAIPGTGLGLYLCKQIIDLSHGHIWVDSQLGKGATFSFNLPVSARQPSVLPKNKLQFKATHTYS